MFGSIADAKRAYTIGSASKLQQLREHSPDREYTPVEYPTVFGDECKEMFAGSWPDERARLSFANVAAVKLEALTRGRAR